MDHPSISMNITFGPANINLPNGPNLQPELEQPTPKALSSLHQRAPRLARETSCEVLFFCWEVVLHQFSSHLSRFFTI